MVQLKIDGIDITVPEGTSILNAAESIGIKIPRLCYHPDLDPVSACRLCVVEITGDRLLRTSCSYKVTEGMDVKTNTPQVRQSRKMAMELLLSRHPQKCTECVRNGNCELQELAELMGIREVRFEYHQRKGDIDLSSPSIVRDPSKCILCRRCIQVCSEVQGVSAIGIEGRGYEAWVDTPFSRGLGEATCVSCGQCIDRCPVGALYEVSHVDRVWEALSDPNKHVVVQTAPAIRAAIGEMFDITAGKPLTGAMVTALRRLGFDRVMDTDFTADLTIMEEGTELIGRLNNGGTLPMITSCSPGWINYIERFYPQLLPHLSTCKSPQQMFGALVKTYYAEKMNVDPATIFSVSLMPCTAKKYEAERPEMNDSGFQDVDAVLTTREIGTMIKQAGIDFANLPDGEHDKPMGISTGAGVIFGATGGVMEAALRTAYEIITGKEIPDLNITAVRGMEGVKEAVVRVGDLDVKAAVAHGLGNARKLLDKIVSGEAEYHFIEIMACPGGCIGGGGQPIPTTLEIRKKRAEAIYAEDAGLPMRKSHENPAIQKIYEEFLGEPNGEKSHHLLHTKYTEKTVY